MTTTLRLMTLNLRLSAADDGPNVWPRRWPYVRALIAEQRPHILGVQECLPDQMAAIMGELPGYLAYMGPDTMIPDRLPQRNPLFVCDPCPMPRQEGALALNDSGVIGQVSWDGREPRLAHLLYGAGWVLANTHFDAWDCDQARLESARLLVDYLRDAPAAVVMGDLNCGPDEAPLDVFRAAGYALAKDSLPSDVDRRTFHDFTGKGQGEIDYILVRGGAVQAVSIPRPRGEAPFLSDHDPLVAEVVLG